MNYIVLREFARPSILRAQTEYLRLKVSKYEKCLFEHFQPVIAPRRCFVKDWEIVDGWLIVHTGKIRYGALACQIRCCKGYIVLDLLDQMSAPPTGLYSWTFAMVLVNIRTWRNGNSSLWVATINTQETKSAILQGE